MATFPLCAYQVTIASAVNVSITLAGDSASLTFPAGTYYGASTATGADTASLPHRFGALVATHPGWGSTPTWAASLEVGATDNARAAWRITYSGGGLDVADTFEITALSGTSASLFGDALGLVVGTTYSIGATSYLQASRRHLGVWSPGAIGTRLEPVYVDIGEGAVSPYDASAHDRVRLGRRLLYSGEWPYVEAADVSREISAQSAGYRTLANREDGETLGTLDDLLGAAGSGSRVRLFTAATTAVDCVLDADGQITRSEYTREESVGGRRYRVVLPLIAASAYTGVYT
jgi:hypothetical protein